MCPTYRVRAPRQRRARWWSSVVPASAAACPVLALCLTVGAAGCASGNRLGNHERFGPRLEPTFASVRARDQVGPGTGTFRAAPRSISITLESPSYVAVFALAEGVVSLFYPYVPWDMVASRWPFPREPVARTHYLRFMERYPEGVTGNPITDGREQTLFEAGQHELIHPPSLLPLMNTRGYRWPQESSFLLLVASEKPLDLSAFVVMGGESAPTNVWEIAEQLIEAMGLDPDAGDWAALLRRL